MINTQVRMGCLLVALTIGFGGCDKISTQNQPSTTPMNTTPVEDIAQRPEKPSSGTFWEAVQNEDWNLVRRWIEYDPQLVNSKGKLTVVRFVFQERQELPMEGMTPLLLAVFRGNMEMVRFLVENGADVNLPDVHRRSPLHYAASHEHNDIQKYLTDKGADVNAKDSQGKRPGEFGYR